MEYESYKIQREEKLEDLAKQFGLTIKELQDLNPKMETFKNFWGTETFVVVNQLIKVPLKTQEKAYGDNLDFDFVQSQKEREENKKELEDIQSQKQSRYRTKQINIVKINDIISAHSTVKCDYRFSEKKVSYGDRYIINLDDSVYNFLHQRI